MSLRKFIRAASSTDEIILPAIGVDPINIWNAADARTVEGRVQVLEPRAGNPANVFIKDADDTSTSAPPLLLTGGHGGVPAIDFNGYSRLKVPSMILPAGCKDMASIAVVKYEVNYPTNIVGAYGFIGDNALYSIGLSAYYLSCYTRGNAGENRQRLAPFTLNTWLRQGGTGYKSDPTPETASYKNGVVGSVTTSTINEDNTDGFAPGGSFYIGGYSLPGTPNTFQGKLTEYYLYPKLTTAQFQALDAFIASQYPPFP